MNHAADGDGLKEKWFELEQIFEKSDKKFKKGTVGAITPIKRAASWQKEDQKDIIDAKVNDDAGTPPTEYEDGDDADPVTSEEKPGVNNYGEPEEKWTQKKVHGDIHESKKIDEMDMLSPAERGENLTSDLKNKYADMQPESEIEMIQRIKAQHESQGSTVEVMLNIDGTIKSLNDWVNGVDPMEEPAPEIPEIPPTMGGGVEDEEENEDDIPFPELEGGLKDQI